MKPLAGMTWTNIFRLAFWAIVISHIPRVWVNGRDVGGHDWHDGWFSVRIGKARAGAALDGIEHKAMPT